MSRCELSCGFIPSALFVVSVTSGVSDVVDSFPADISQLSWNINGNNPKKKLVLNGGRTVVLGFNMEDVRHLNLEIPVVSGAPICNHFDFLGSDMLIYLQSSSDFGEIISGTQDSPGCFDGDDDDITHRPDTGYVGATSGAILGALFIALLAFQRNIK